jgi:hypothetical protein
MLTTPDVTPMTLSELAGMFAQFEGSSEWAFNRFSKVADLYTRMDADDRAYFTREGYPAFRRLADEAVSCLT